MYCLVEIPLILLGPWIRLHTVHLVYNYPVIIDLPNLVEMAEVVEADFAV